MVRLQKYLAGCGVASRRASEQLIEAGRVTVNGAVAQLGVSIDPETDSVCVDGQSVGEDRPVYVLLHKPAGVICSASDTHGRKTVVDCVQGVGARVYPVGRLDLDVSGVLLLTNDGELSHRLLHPSYGAKKIYHAQVRGTVAPETLTRFTEGIALEDGLTAPAQARIIKRAPQRTTLELTLHEGRKREVKRMCAAVGHSVVRLERIAFAGLRAHGLEPGQWRLLTAQEAAVLRKHAGLQE